ncbi:hypothetical protein DN37_1510 [Vibrio cholerae]|nr:hypothetical protein DN37_1510 [Vibrio cholerae]
MDRGRSHRSASFLGAIRYPKHIAGLFRLDYQKIFENDSSSKRFLVVCQSDILAPSLPRRLAMAGHRQFP